RVPARDDEPPSLRSSGLRVHDADRTVQLHLLDARSRDREPRRQRLAVRSPRRRSGLAARLGEAARTVTFQLTGIVMQMKSIVRVRALWVFLFFIPLACGASDARKPPHAAIASAHELATRAGLEILQQGGNAFDAAVAVSAALAVVEPSSSGLGGGGFWLLHRASDGFEVMVDAREVAPLAATRDMFLDEQGNVVRERSTQSALAAG